MPFIPPVKEITVYDFTKQDDRDHIEYLEDRVQQLEEEVFALSEAVTSLLLRKPIIEVRS